MYSILKICSDGFYSQANRIVGTNVFEITDAPLNPMIEQEIHKIMDPVLMSLQKVEF